MSYLIVTDRDGRSHKLDAPEGWRVMEILRDSSVGVEGLCGGACDCATCHVTLSEEWRERLYPPGEEELDKLAELPNADESSRLSCQIIWQDQMEGLQLTIAED